MAAGRGVSEAAGPLAVGPLAVHGRRRGVGLVWVVGVPPVAFLGGQLGTPGRHRACLCKPLSPMT